MSDIRYGIFKGGERSLRLEPGGKSAMGPEEVRLELAKVLDPARGNGRSIHGPKGLGPTVVEIGAAPRGRATGYAVACRAHGAMPVLAPNRRQAITAAGRHLESEHGGLGRIVDRARLAGRRR